MNFNLKEALLAFILTMLLMVGFTAATAQRGLHNNPVAEVGLFANGFSAGIETGPNYGISIEFHEMFDGVEATTLSDIRASVVNSNPYWIGLDVGWAMLSVADAPTFRHRYKYWTFQLKGGLAYRFIYGYVYGKHYANFSSTIETNRPVDRTFTEAGAGVKVKLVPLNNIPMTVSLWGSLGKILGGSPFLNNDQPFTTQLGVSISHIISL